MEQTEAWDKEGVSVISQNQDQLQKKQDKQSNQHELATQPMIEQIQDDLTQLRNKQNQTPLVFYGKIGNSFLISYNKSECICIHYLVCSFIARYIPICIFFIITQIIVQIFAIVSQQVKVVLVCLCVVQIIAFLLIFLVDPGTLFEDQTGKIDQQKLYCQTCRIYKRPKTHHCKYCVKCVRGYDHHCGFFGKCIGRGNYFLFGFFICTSSLTCIGSMASLAYTVFKPLI